MADEKKEWHLNKAVPLSLIFAVTVQFAVTVAWATSLSGQVDMNTRAVEGVPEITKDMAVLKSDMMHVREDVSEIKDILREMPK